MKNLQWGMGRRKAAAPKPLTVLQQINQRVCADRALPSAVQRENYLRSLLGLPAVRPARDIDKERGG